MILCFFSNVPSLYPPMKNNNGLISTVCYDDFKPVMQFTLQRKMLKSKLLRYIWIRDSSKTVFRDFLCLNYKKSQKKSAYTTVLWQVFYSESSRSFISRTFIVHVNVHKCSWTFTDVHEPPKMEFSSNKD